MASIPYQPTYSVQPKYGFRYAASQFAPAGQTVAPPPVGLQGSSATPPPVMGTQQGTTAPAYTQDPLNSGGGADQPAPVDNRALAQSYGYESGTQNIAAGLASMVPVIGAPLSSAIRGNAPADTFGDPGTYDTQGNVFGDTGRAYSPVTGSAVPVYADKSSALSNITDSYSNLRSSGEGVIGSALGSYDNSVYKQMELDPTLSIEGARQARMMGINSPIENLNKTITNNTINQKYDEEGLIGNGPIWGTQAGDYVQSNQGPLSVTSSGGLQDQYGGNVVQLDGVSFINADITDRASLNDAQRSMLDSRTSTTPQTDSMNPTIQDRDRTVGTGITSPTKSYQDILNDIIDPTKAISSDKTVGVGDMIKAGALTPVSVSTPSYADDSNNGGGTDPDANDDSGMSGNSFGDITTNVGTTVSAEDRRGGAGEAAAIASYVAAKEKQQQDSSDSSSGGK